MAELNDDEVAVKKADLKKWLDTITELRAFKNDAENDIGWVVKSFYGVAVNGSPMKIISKLVMGKMDLKEIIDPDRLKAIGEKYAPATMAELKNLKS